MKQYFFLCLLFAVSLISCENKTNSAPLFIEQPIFINGVGGYECYRIPAIVSNNKGILFAFVEGRVNDCGDYGNVDILLSISKDNGDHWSIPKKIIDKDKYQAGNAAPVYDFTDPRYPNGRLFLFFNTGNASEYDVRMGIGDRKVWFTTSPNDGIDWDVPTDISNQVHFNKENSRLDKDWRLPP